MMSINIKI